MSLKIEHCTVKAGKRTILDVVQAAFPQGQVSAVIGPNGAGKSTLLKQFLTHPQAFWRQGSLKTALKQGKIAWVGQHERFQLPMTLTEYVLMGRYPQLAWYERPKRADAEQAAQLLDEFDLGSLKHKRIQTLSGGEQQRAAIVRALLQNAEVLLLDEPTNHLDVRHQHRLMHYLYGLRAQGLTVVMVLHDLNLAAHYADYALLMNQGKICAAGAIGDVMQAELLSEVYGWTIERRGQGSGSWFQAQVLSKTDFQAA